MQMYWVFVKQHGKSRWQRFNPSNGEIVVNLFHHEQFCESSLKKVQEYVDEANKDEAWGYTLEIRKVPAPQSLGGSDGILKDLEVPN